MKLPVALEDMISSSQLWQSVALPIRNQLQLQQWLKNDRRTSPPHGVKVRNLLVVADLFNLDILIETGTNKGRMIDATIDRFKKIYSIEIFPPLAERARRRFARKPSVSIMMGDSATILPMLLSTILEPAIFWLDGHYSGHGTGMSATETPVLAEINHILRMRKGFADAIVIDDARCFIGAEGYPRLNEFLADLKSSFGCTPIVRDDSIFILPTVT